MQSLPVEIIDAIFKEADGTSLYHCAMVCQEWYELSMDYVKPINDRKQFKQACQGGDMLSVIRCKHVKRWVNDGLNRACHGGHRELVDLMISKGATKCTCGKSLSAH